MESRLNNLSSALTVAPVRRTNGPGNRLPGEWQSCDLPGDLRDWFDSCAILAWIEQELDKLDWGHPILLDHLQRYPEYRPRTLLRLLTYAYATGVFSSVDIVRACCADKFFRLLCEGKPPFPQELASFRRRNPSLVQTVLVQLFRVACRERLRVNAAWATPDLLEKATARLDSARHLDRADE